VSAGRPHRRRLTRTQSEVANLLGPLDGAFVPGGCDSCNAEQTAVAAAPGVWQILVAHDDECPVLSRVRGQR